MKKAIKVLGILIIIGIIYLAVAGREIQIIKTEIDIAAPKAKVWDILIDVDKWQEWNPTINESKGIANLGSTLSITMMSDVKGKDGPQYNPKIIKLDEPNAFHWRAFLLTGFIFTNDKIIELKETATGTKVIHSETFKGMMVPIFRSKMEKGVAPILNIMNESLKTLAEK